MGCDIHCYLENEVTGEYGEKRWVAVSSAKMDRIIKSRLVENARWANDKSMLRHVRTPFYSGRNYDLFSMLSGVRGNLNSLCPKGQYGNCQSADGKEDIMPEDVSNKIFNMYRRGRGDWHSLTIFTLKEILVDNKAFWEQTIEGEDWENQTDYNKKPTIKTFKYSELAHTFLENCEDIARHAKWKNLEKYRLVMWYDN